jgi:hypothetical protein
MNTDEQEIIIQVITKRKNCPYRDNNKCKFEYKDCIDENCLFPLFYDESEKGLCNNT